MARSLRTTPLLTREHFLESYGTDYHATQGVRPLDEVNVFSSNGSLTYGTPACAYVHVLGLLTHFSGSLESVPSLTNKPTRYRGEIARTALSPDFCVSAQKHLGLTFSQKTCMSKFGTNGGSYARLLGLLGFPCSDGTSHLGRVRNTKAVRDVTLPSYLTHLLENYPSFCVGEQRLAESFLRDYVNVFLSTRYLDRNTLHYEASLFSQPSEERLHTQTTSLFSALKILYPAAFTGLSFQENVQVTTFMQKDNCFYRGEVRLPLERLMQLPLNHNLCVGVRVVPREPTFYFKKREILTA